MGQPDFPMQCFWHLALCWLCLAVASVSSADSRLCSHIHIKNMDTSYSQVVDSSTCEGLLSEHGLANHALYTVSCSEIFQDFCTFPSGEWCLQQEQVCICYCCQAGLLWDFFWRKLRTVSIPSHHIQQPTYVLTEIYHYSKPENHYGQSMGWSPYHNLVPQKWCTWGR